MKTAEEILMDKGTHMECVSPNATIADALKIMIDKNFGAIVVKENDDVVGIWTERDLMKNSLNGDFDLYTSKVGDYMKTNLESVDAGDAIYRLSDKILGIKIRHLFVTKNDKIIGLLSVGDVIRACLIERTHQLQDLSLEYYEAWKHN